MATFFTILFILLAVNSILLIFSINGAREKSRKTIQKISEASVTKISPNKSSETEYKKAV